MDGDDKSGEISLTHPADPKEETSSRASVSSERRRSSLKSSLKPESSPSTIPEATQQQEVQEEETDALQTVPAAPDISSSRNQSLSSPSFRLNRDIRSSHKSSLSSSSPLDLSTSSRRPSRLSSSSSPSAYPETSPSSRKPSISSSSPDYPTVSSSRRSSFLPQPDPNPEGVSSSADPKLQSPQRPSLWPQPDPNPAEVSSSADPKLDSFQRSSLSPQPDRIQDVSSSAEPTPSGVPGDRPRAAGETLPDEAAAAARPPPPPEKASITSKLLSFVATSPFPFLTTRGSLVSKAAGAAEFQFEGASATLVVPVTEEQGMAEFLQKRTAAAAQHRHKLSGDPSSPASKALVERRQQVFSTVQKARERLSSLSVQTVRRKTHISKGLWGRFRRWVFEREQRRLRGKGLNHLKLWNESLKKMEGGYGSSMMLAFAFIRWVLLLNFVLSSVWLALMILPFLAHPPKSFHWHTLEATFGSTNGLKDVIQGKSLERTFVYYGGYTYTYSEQKGLWRVDYMYPLLIGATFLLSFLGILGRIARRIMNAGDISMAAHYFPFSSLVFASWDFHITSLEAAAKLRRGIRMQLKEAYADALLKRKKSGPMHQFMSAQRFLALCILWPSTMVGVVLAVDGLSKNTNLINSYFGSNYAQAFLFGLLNNIGPVVVRILVEMENFKPATAERVVIAKLFFLRFLNLATFYSSSIHVLVNTRALRAINGHDGNCFDKYCSDGLHCCDKGYPEWNICDDVDIQMHLCVPTCAENYVGGQILRLIVISSISRAVFELIYGYGYLVLYHGNKRQLLIEDMAMDVVYVQALVWWGVCFSPMAPIFGFLSNFFTFYTMRIALFKTCAPVEKAFSASRTSTLTYGVLLFTLILSTIPVSIVVMEKKDGFCGPIYTRSSMYDIINGYMQKAPTSLWLAFTWLLNPAVLLGVIFFLIFIVVLVQSQLIETRQFLALTKFEMGSQRKESIEKLKRMRQDLQSSLHKSTSGSPTSSKLAAALSEWHWLPNASLHLDDANPLDCLHDGDSSQQDTSAIDHAYNTTSHHKDNTNHESRSSSVSGSFKDAGFIPMEAEESQTAPTKSQPTLVTSPSEGPNETPIGHHTNNQDVEAQDWHSLGKILRRLSQTQQTKLELATKDAHHERQESSLEDWHSLGQVLRRLSQQNIEMDNVSAKSKDNSMASIEDDHVTTDDSKQLDSSKHNGPSVMPKQTSLHDEPIGHVKKSTQFLSSAEDPLEKETPTGSSKPVVLRTQSIQISKSPLDQDIEPASSQKGKKMGLVSSLAQMVSQSMGSFSGESDSSPTQQPFSHDNHIASNTSFDRTSAQNFQNSPPPNSLTENSKGVSTIEQDSRLSTNSSAITLAEVLPNTKPNDQPIVERPSPPKLSFVDKYFPHAKVLRESWRNRLRKRAIKTNQPSQSSPRRGRQRKRKRRKRQGKSGGKSGQSTPSPKGKHHGESSTPKANGKQKLP